MDYQEQREHDFKVYFQEKLADFKEQEKAKWNGTEEAFEEWFTENIPQWEEEAREYYFAEDEEV